MRSGWSMTSAPGCIRTNGCFRGQAKTTDEGGLKKYVVAGHTVTFLHEDLAVTMLKQLGMVKNGPAIEFPEI